MQPDSMLTTHQMIHDAENYVRKYFDECLTSFAEWEPELGQFIAYESVRICGKLALSGVHRGILEGLLDDMRHLILTALMAALRGQYELWKDTQAGTHLADLWESVKRSAHEDGTPTSHRD